MLCFVGEYKREKVREIIGGKDQRSCLGKLVVEDGEITKEDDGVMFILRYQYLNFIGDNYGKYLFDSIFRA